MIDVNATLQTLPQLATGSIGVWLSMEIVKGLSWIPVNEGDKTKIRAVAGGFSLLATLLLGAVNQNLQPTDVQHFLALVVSAAAMWGGSHLTHKVVQK